MLSILLLLACWLPVISGSYMRYGRSPPTRTTTFSNPPTSLSLLRATSILSASQNTYLISGRPGTAVPSTLPTAIRGESVTPPYQIHNQTALAAAHSEASLRAFASSHPSLVTSKSRASFTSVHRTSSYPGPTLPSSHSGGLPTSTPTLGDGISLDAPAYNLNNMTCDDVTSGRSPSEQWALVDGDTVVSTFENMYQNNLLVCNECFGKPQNQCDSKNCQLGLQNLSKVKGSNEPRWDNAAAQSAHDADITDFQCLIGDSQCSSPPSCMACNGPGSWAILKSLSVLNMELNNAYSAIRDAGSACSYQMTAFSAAFSPVPSIQDKATRESVGFAIAGALVGLTAIMGPEMGFFGAALGLGLGIGGDIFMNNMFYSQPLPADTDQILGFIANTTAQQYFTMSDALFTNGTYTYVSADGKKGTELALDKLFQNGSYLANDASNSSLYKSLLPAYQKVMFQQLAYYTWTNMPSDGNKHNPFIVFTNQSCDKIDRSTWEFYPGQIGDTLTLLTINTNITHNGSCYWLLDAMNKDNKCVGAQALQGGTTDELIKNDFAGLRIEDFIIASVDGWAKNGKNNDYVAASTNGQLVADARAPGALNITVCDYIGSYENPGVGCSKFGDVDSTGNCELVPRNSIGNSPGGFAVGSCKVHVSQYQKNEGDENPYSNYQLEVTVYDDAGRPVGDGAKELAAEPLEIPGSLPYQLIVGAGKLDSDPVEFWYADDYWNSNDQSHQCNTGAYESGVRQMDCQFPCDAAPPTFGDSHSATIGHLMFAAPTEAIADVVYQNTFATPTPTAPPPPPPAPHPGNAQNGQCQLHVRQHQKKEAIQNDTPNYKLEITLMGNDGGKDGQSGEVSAPAGRIISVVGFDVPLNVSTGNVDNDPITFALGTEQWNSNDKQCKVGGYDSGHRDMDCWFACPTG